MKKFVYTVLLIFFSLFTILGIWGLLVMISEADSFNIIVYSIWSLLGISLFFYFFNKRKNLSPNHSSGDVKSKTNKQRKNNAEIDISKNPKVTADDIHQPVKKAYTFPVVGVTFNTGRKSRQVALRHIHFHDEPYETVNIQIKEYDYDGELALGVYANDFQVGNISKANINRVHSLLSDGYSIDYQIYGGGNKNWGMSITLYKIEE